MHSNATSTRTFSDMAASYASVSESAQRLQLRLKLKGLESGGKAQPEHEIDMLPIFIAVLWGAGLFGVLEVDSWAVKTVIIAFMAIGSLGMELLFHRR